MAALGGNSRVAAVAETDGGAVIGITATGGGDGDLAEQGEAGHRQRLRPDFPPVAHGAGCPPAGVDAVRKSRRIHHAGYAPGQGFIKAKTGSKGARGAAQSMTPRDA